MADMPGSESQLWIPALFLVCSGLQLGVLFFVWFASRAKKVRLLEDQVLSQLRSYQSRADQVDTRIGEWQVTVTDLLAQVEDFFERTVRERKRISQQNAQAKRGERDGDEREIDISTLPRAQQLQLVDEHFRKMGR